jgi:hypothetical protein
MRLSSKVPGSRTSTDLFEDTLQLTVVIEQNSLKMVTEEAIALFYSFIYLLIALFYLLSPARLFFKACCWCYLCTKLRWRYIKFL